MKTCSIRPSGLPSSGSPLTWLAEVTDDERFTGGHLARTSSARLITLPREFNVETVRG